MQNWTILYIKKKTMKPCVNLEEDCCMVWMAEKKSREKHESILIKLLKKAVWRDTAISVICIRREFILHGVTKWLKNIISLLKELYQQLRLNLHHRLIQHPRLHQHPRLRRHLRLHQRLLCLQIMCKNRQLQVVQTARIWEVVETSGTIMLAHRL